MSNLIIRELAEQTRTEWTIRFNGYRNSMSFADAVQQIWDDFNVVGNPYLRLFPNVEALVFVLVTYIPNRAEGANISTQPPLIVWDSTPIYETMYNWWNNVRIWNCTDWKNWHIALETHFSDTYKANEVWEVAWHDEKNQCALLSTVVCPDTDSCRYDCSFVEYLVSKEISVGNLLSNTTCNLNNIVLNIVKTVNNVTQTAANTTEVMSNTIPWVAGALIIGGGLKLAKVI